MENEQEETYDEPDWIDRHSVNCFICGKLVDERDCIPGSDGLLKSADEAKKLAAKIKYPIILKATAGGGYDAMERGAFKMDLLYEFDLEHDRPTGSPGHLSRRRLVPRIGCGARGDDISLAVGLPARRSRH